MEYPTICVARCLGPSPLAEHYTSYGQMWKKGVRHEVTTINVPVYVGRNQAVKLFFNCIPADEYLVFFDDDMIFPPDTIHKLVSHRLPVVGGLYFMKKPPYHPLLFRSSGKVLVMDTMFGETGGYDIVRVWGDGELIKVDACGAGCLAIRRDVLEAIPYPWFSFQEGTEDMWFCHLAQRAGFPIHVDTSIECGHMARVPIGKGHYKAWREAQERGLKAPPAEKTAFIADRPWIADVDLEAPPQKQMHYVHREWSRDTTPGPGLVEEKKEKVEYPY